MWKEGTVDRWEKKIDLASYGESSCVNAIVNAMRIARKIKYRHGYRSHLRLPLPPRTSSKGVSKLYTRLYTSILGCRVACMHTRVEGKRERERGTIALNSRFARSHFTNLHCNETGGRCRWRRRKIRRNGISVAAWKFSTADGCQSFRDRFSSKSSRCNMCIYVCVYIYIYNSVGCNLFKLKKKY